MDSNHNKNIYTNKDADLYGGYGRTPCAQQSQSSQRAQHQPFLPPYAMSISNNMPQQLMYNTQNQPMYNIMYGHQPLYRNQNSFPPNSSINAFTQPIDPVSWVPESCIGNSDTSKYDNKMKQTNSTSCCANRVECSSLSNVYKSKNFYYNKNSLVDPQWFYGSNYDNQKYNELPSCSQVTSDNSAPINECCNLPAKSVKSVKYCTIQKCPETDSKLYMYPNKYENHSSYVDQPYNKVKDYPSCSQLASTCNFYNGTSACLEMDKKILDHCEIGNTCDIMLPPAPNPGFFASAEGDCPESSLQPFDVPKIGEKTPDESNGAGGESDIVVEDSEEEVTDESEEVEKDEEVGKVLQTCLVCNITVVESQFCVITDSTPLSSYSHTPLWTLLDSSLNLAATQAASCQRNLCSDCLNLINTLDNLEIQLNIVKRDLLQKYKSTVDNLKVFISANADVEQVILDVEENKMVAKVPSAKFTRCKLKNICGVHSFKCRVCEKIFSLKKFYRYHMSKHKIKSSYLCEKCGCHFSKHSNLLAHLRRHLNHFPLRCSLCKKGFIYENSLRQHKCSKPGLKAYICHICGRTFRNRAHLKEHEFSCSGELPHGCQKCAKRFPSASKLNQHVKLYHDKIFSNSCEICGKGFVKPSDFKSHLLTHSEEKNFKCETCGNAYKTLSNLNQHRKVHAGELPFKCSVCQKGFVRKENLEAHLNVHNGVKPFNCSICDKKFASQKNLDAHLRVHKGTTKKKTCSVCGKQISHGLEEHLRTHSNLKEFECGNCPLKFSTKGALAKHRKRKHDSTDLDVL